MEAAVSVDDLRDNIDIILAQSDRMSYYDLAASVSGPVEDHPYIAQPGEAELVNERVIALRLLYAQASPDEQAEFPLLLTDRLDLSNARTLVHVAVEIGLLPGGVNGWFGKESADAQRALWAGLTEKMTLESHLFTDAAIIELLQFMKVERALLPPSSADKPPYLAGTLDYFATVARKVQFLLLSRRLKEGHNPEINADKKELVSRMGQLGFRADIARTLEELEGKILAASTPLAFKGCMEAMRTIYEEVVEDAAKTVAAITNTTYPPPKTDFGPWNKLLVDTGILTSDEGTLTKDLYACFSNVASHRLGSAPEQLRVTKNMVIELGLLIVGRVQALKAEGGRSSAGAK